MSDDKKQNLDAPGNPQSQDSESSEQIIKLYAPQPLTEEQFDEILIRKYFALMDNRSFKQLFGKDLTSENVDHILSDGAHFPSNLLRVIKQSVLATYKTIENMAIDGKSEVAWNMIENLCAFSPNDLRYIHYKEGNTPDYKPYIRARLSQVDHISNVLDFIDLIDEANEISASNSAVISMKNAEKIYSNLRLYEPNLDAEQKSNIYYLSSEVFRRAQIIPGVYREPSPCTKEIFCLRMVLENTSQLSLIDCCMGRISSDNNILKQNIPLLIAAYKRVLKKQQTIFPEDEYRINSQIADLYKSGVNAPKSSYTGPDLQDISNLRWAEYYYNQAYKKAPNNNKKYEALTSVAQVQRLLGESSRARNNLVKAAYFLPKPDCHEKALDIAAQDKDYGILLIKQSLKKIKKDRLPVGIKNILYDKALRITHQQTKDPQVISSVEALLPNKKLTPNNKIVRNVSTHE